MVKAFEKNFVENINKAMRDTYTQDEEIVEVGNYNTPKENKITRSVFKIYKHKCFFQ